MKKKWRILGEGKNGTLLEKLLYARGISSKEEAEIFLNPLDGELISPYAFCDMQRAVDRITSAISNNEKILIWGDFDADGVTSTSILFKTLRAIGADFINYIPNRKTQGHGLNSKELIQFISKEKIKLVITLDCGISNVKEVDLLKSFKVDTIITDHHKAEDIVPAAYAIIDANAPDTVDEKLSVNDIASLSNLCGAGVAFKLYLALCDKFENLKKLHDEILCLCAVGTISDVVPLLGENRKLVARGIKLINENCHKGISSLMAQCGKEKNITSIDIAFVLTPRINAAGRLADVSEAFELLTTDDEAKFKVLTAKLSNFNAIRQDMCNDTFEEARAEILKNNLQKERAIVLLNENWHVGIVGIVASKVVEEFLRPAFLMTLDDTKTVAKCSIRSTKGVNVYEVLSNLSENFIGYGGHALAGGFSFDLKEHTFEEIKTKILSTIDELYQEDVIDETFDIDLELEASNLTEDLMSTLSALEPYGEKNPSPVFCMKNVKYLSHKFMGKKAEHLKILAQKDDCALTCLWWGKSVFDPPQTLFDVAFSPFINEFNNERAIQLEILDTSLDEFVEDNIKIYDHRKKENILLSVDEYLKTHEDVFSYAKRIETVKNLGDYPSISKSCENFEIGRGISSQNIAKCLMFFDYPPSKEAFLNVLDDFKPSKIHIFREEFSENIENYIKTLSGMLKFANNKRGGEIDIEKMAQLLGVSEKFVNIALLILEDIGAIKILSSLKIQFLCAFSNDKFLENEKFADLSDEFENILNFKNSLQNTDCETIRELVR